MQGMIPPKRSLSGLILVPASTQMSTGPASTVQGFDFSFRGINEIWESFSPASSPNTTTTVVTTTSSGSSASSSISPLPNMQAISSIGGNKVTSGARRTQIPVEATRGPWQDALKEICLNSRRRANNEENDFHESDSWRPFTNSNKLEQREVALALCAWSLRLNDVRAKASKSVSFPLLLLTLFKNLRIQRCVNRWEKRGDRTRAACWLFCMGQRPEAFELLRRSRGKCLFSYSDRLLTFIFR